MKRTTKRMMLPLLMLGLPWAASRADLVYTTIDVPGATSTSAFGISDSGNVAGGYTDSSGVSHGFLMTGSTVTTVDYPGAGGTTHPYSANDSGEVVGIYHVCMFSWFLVRRHQLRRN